MSASECGQIGATDVTREMTGWKHAAYDAPEVAAELRELRERLPFELHEIIVCGMGGSALAAYVLKSLLDPCVPVRVVDTTAPAYVQRVLDEMDGAGTLLVVASKSGTTLEPNVLYRVFAQRLAERLGSTEAAAQHCVALTDPGTALEALAREKDWLAVVLTPADVGGRYSALTAFGLAPVVLAEAEVDPLIACAQAAESRGGSSQLTDFLAESEQAGRDVILLVLPPELTSVGRWLEQLIAESLGKEGRGLVPVVTTPKRAEELLLFSPRARAIISVVTIGEDDRMGSGTVLSLNDKTVPDPILSSSRVRETAQALDVPVCVYHLAGSNDLGALFVDWEFAVAACGERLGINPFDQPDVAASKEATNHILAGESTDVQDGKILLRPLSELPAVVADRAVHYLALLAWLPYSKGNDDLLQQQACKLEQTYGLPVALCYGPRYLHSTGQGYKGGPATGLFLFTGDGESADLPIPEYDFTLAQLFAAQRQGDIEALAARGCPVFG
ncbi:MAG: hypothetical protein FWF45_08055 [Coriobacteriia bacterium]|nr:hypothetical protein [Coriobacteriia bacterium]